MVTMKTQDVYEAMSASPIWATISVEEQDEAVYETLRNLGIVK